mgnify:CR=1 FL=1
MTSLNGNALSVLLLRPAEWQPIMGDAAAAIGRGAKPLELALMASIVESLHAKHIGIPPRVAGGLANVLLQPTLHPANYPVPWRHVAGALAEARDDTFDGLQTRLQQSTRNLRLDGSVPYTIFQIAAPVIERACRRLGRVVLFSQDAEASAMSLSDYADYTDSIIAEVVKLAMYDPKGDLVLFWQERAMAIVDMTAAKPSRELSKTALPQADPHELGLFRRLRSDSDGDQRKAPDFLLSQRPRAWDDRRRRDAGVDGVKITRRPEDIQYRLLSERIYPDIIQLDRILNSGYWILNRPPKPMEIRDLLVVGIHPGPASGFTSSPRDSFIKATWFEFACYIARILQTERMAQTELRWIDGDAGGRWRALSLRLSNLPDISATTRTFAGYRNVFRLRSGWLPHLFDRRAHYQTLPSYASDAENSMNPFDWARPVWLEQRESAAWLPQQASVRFAGDHHVPVATAFTDKSIEMQRFFHIHLMLLLPEQLRPTDGKRTDPSANQNALKHLFHMDAPGRSVSITWIPRDLVKGEWRIDAHTQLDAQMTNPMPKQGQQVATHLIRKWTENLAMEVAYG